MHFKRAYIIFYEVWETPKQERIDFNLNGEVYQLEYKFGHFPEHEFNEKQPNWQNRFFRTLFDGNVCGNSAAGKITIPDHRKNTHFVEDGYVWFMEYPYFYFSYYCLPIDVLRIDDFIRLSANSDCSSEWWNMLCDLLPSRNYKYNYQRDLNYLLFLDPSESIESENVPKKINELFGDSKRNIFTFVSLYGCNLCPNSIGPMKSTAIFSQVSLAPDIEERDNIFVVPEVVLEFVWLRNATKVVDNLDSLSRSHKLYRKNTSRYLKDLSLAEKSKINIHEKFLIDREKDLELQIQGNEVVRITQRECDSMSLFRYREHIIHVDARYDGVKSDALSSAIIGLEHMISNLQESMERIILRSNILADFLRDSAMAEATSSNIHLQKSIHKLTKVAVAIALISVFIALIGILISVNPDEIIQQLLTYLERYR